jgi:predicted small lipoprotein YifL
MVIIAVFLLSFSGCGYKADPYYLEDAPSGDDNVKFILTKPKSDNSESNDTK